MAKYLVIYNNTKQEEVVATRHVDVKTWLVFQQDDDEGVPTEILRVKSAVVRRVELLEK